MGALYYWGQKSPVNLLNERIGKAQFWFLFLGTQVFTFPMYVLGLWGMPRRVGIYPNHPGWQDLNDVATVGAIMIGISSALFLVNIMYSWKKYPAGDNPWTGTRSSGSRPLPRRITTSTVCPRFARSVRRGTTTTPDTRPPRTDTPPNR